VNQSIEVPDGCHSEEFVVMFLGYLCAALPELHQFECPKILEAWEQFKTEMGKRTISST